MKTIFLIHAKIQEIILIKIIRLKIFKIILFKKLIPFSKAKIQLLLKILIKI